jgi:hypothetical protein
VNRARIILLDLTTLKEREPMDKVEKQPLDFNTFIAKLENWIEKTSIDHRHDIIGNTHIYFIKHEFGEGWSLYHKT